MQMHCHMNTALFTALFIIYYNYYLFLYKYSIK